jgi:phosphohistidine phosphatase
VPDTILASTAVRARTTAELVAEAAGFDGRIVKLAELYLASPAMIVDLVGRLPAGCRRAMVVAHNPGLEELVERLTGRDERFPTAALAAVELPIDDWIELELGILGKLAGLWRPKEL